MTGDLTLLVIAKAPEPGRVKTRLCPPCTPTQAATLAEAALADTLATVAAMPARRRVLALDGRVGPWLPEGFDVVGQPQGGLDERLAAAFDTVDGAAFLVGMDTPQLTAAQLEEASRLLAPGQHDAVLGPAIDGGWWAIGLRESDPRVFLGIPTSTECTGAHQWRRLVELGLAPALLPTLRDVDTFADARLVAAAAPSSRFAREVARLGAVRESAVSVR